MGAITQLLGGMTQVWPNVAFIVCAFVILIFKPERITRSSLFWFGCLFFALSLIAPTLVMFVSTDTAPAPRAVRSDSIPLELKLINLVSSLFYAGAFLATVSSLMPTNSRKTPDATDGAP